MVTEVIRDTILLSRTFENTALKVVDSPEKSTESNDGVFFF